MEARIARLESDVAHLTKDVADIKVDVRSLRDRVDALGERVDAKIEALGVRFASDLATTRNWTFALYASFTAALLGTMARGFGWI